MKAEADEEVVKLCLSNPGLAEHRYEVWMRGGASPKKRKNTRVEFRIAACRKYINLFRPVPLLMMPASSPFAGNSVADFCSEDPIQAELMYDKLESKADPTVIDARLLLAFDKHLPDAAQDTFSATAKYARQRIVDVDRDRYNRRSIETCYLELQRNEYRSPLQTRVMHGLGRAIRARSHDDYIVDFSFWYRRPGNGMVIWKFAQQKPEYFRLMYQTMVSLKNKNDGVVLHYMRQFIPGSRSAADEGVELEELREEDEDEEDSVDEDDEAEEEEEIKTPPKKRQRLDDRDDDDESDDDEEEEDDEESIDGDYLGEGPRAGKEEEVAPVSSVVTRGQKRLEEEEKRKASNKGLDQVSKALFKKEAASDDGVEGEREFTGDTDDEEENGEALAASGAPPKEPVTTTKGGRRK
jgi:hypothetical protein